MNGDQKSDVYAQEKQDFIKHFWIVRVLTENEMGPPETGDAIAQLKEVLECNAIRGKYHQGLMVLIDWYQKAGVDLDTINDRVLLEACIYHLLRYMFCCMEQPYYLNVIKLFLQSSHQTEIGQTLDLITACPPTPTMCMVGFNDKKEYTNVRKILLEMGEFFQIQDDYLDLFGDPSVTGRIGTDIQDNKCSWLVVQCLQQATPEQVLQENYGQKEAEKVDSVKTLYKYLDLPAVFLQSEEDRSTLWVSSRSTQYTCPSPAIFQGLVHKNL
ncbi:Farnesyl pyrophosphate synthase [Plecturocebus cupreus]